MVHVVAIDRTELGPLVPKPRVGLNQFHVVLVRPRLPIDRWVYVVDPSLTALLPVLCRDHFRHLRPATRAVLRYRLTKHLVLFLGPRPLDPLRRHSAIPHSATGNGGSTASSSTTDPRSTVSTCERTHRHSGVRFLLPAVAATAALTSLRPLPPALLVLDPAGCLVQVLH